MSSEAEFTVRGGATLLILSLLSAVTVEASCVRSNRSEPVNVNHSVQLVFNGFSSTEVGSLQAGYQAWNRPSCNPGGTAFSMFSETFEFGARRVQVSAHAGFGPNQNSCGNANAVEITLYEFARDPNGNLVPCMRSDILTDTMSHELGHILGLADQGVSCGTYIMGQVNMGSDGRSYLNRSIKGQECTVVDETSRTPAEQAPDEDTGEENQDEGGGSTTGDDNTSPIVVDLGNDGFEFSGLGDTVDFDIDADGEAETLCWVDLGSNEAFLFLDRNGDGQVNDGGELFGDSTEQPPTERPNGYLALAVFDEPAAGGNGDLEITVEDAVFSSLRLWTDDNRDGVSQPWELQSLSWAGIVSIDLRYFEARQQDRHGNQLRYVSQVTLANGRRLRTVDVFFLLAE